MACNISIFCSPRNNLYLENSETGKTYFIARKEGADLPYIIKQLRDDLIGRGRNLDFIAQSRMILPWEYLL